MKLKKKLHNMGSSPNIIRAAKSRTRWVACSMHGEMVNTYIFLAGKPEGKRPLERPRSRWEKCVKIDLKDVVNRGVN
jgi:hypothetical protein